MQHFRKRKKQRRIICTLDATMIVACGSVLSWIDQSRRSSAVLMRQGFASGSREYLTYTLPLIVQADARPFSLTPFLAKWNKEAAVGVRSSLIKTGDCKPLSTHLAL